MRNLNHLQVKASTRFDENDPTQEGNKNTKFTDLLIDGNSLYQMLKKYDKIPSLGWGSEAYQKRMIDYFLLNTMHTYMYYRYPILVCPWCGDEECGFISVNIVREDDVVIWQDFKLESEGRPINIGPFYFKWEDYEKVIQSTYGVASVQ
ncbi:oxidoreductase [Paenibacillus septentrionalis]|uniref:Oxidoreductase n=1 Tax=Paenibacillus septentrionalis TaxID=429342 RepID=A0ABW1V5B6_9BACL